MTRRQRRVICILQILLARGISTVGFNHPNLGIITAESSLAFLLSGFYRSTTSGLSRVKSCVSTQNIALNALPGKDGNV